ncbi:MAG: mRNA splicing protein sme1 [Chaenotheca gracillima]|nr:MAG: mRNA splicing protein sme1 [Chaenotheca gracillima]
MASLQLAKKDLRQKVKRVLSELAPETIATQTQIVTKALLELPEFQTAKKISVYCSMPSGEISTAPIVYESLAQGKKLFIPYTHRVTSPGPDQPKSVMDMLSLKSKEDYESLGPDNWGIPTPSKDSIAEREDCLKELESLGSGSSYRGIDMIIMPGMAFDTTLKRLGHGKGFYDYYLQRYSNLCDQSKDIKMPVLVGIALKEQVLADRETIPTNETDWPLDKLIIGDGRVLHRESVTSSK